jgi:hypothetical protein
MKLVPTKYAILSPATQIFQEISIKIPIKNTQESYKKPVIVLGLTT